jgi:hypothetical protein
MLQRDYDHEVTGAKKKKKKLSSRESKGICRQDELTGGKTPP